jgi:stage II sporulation protein M
MVKRKVKKKRINEFFYGNFVEGLKYIKEIKNYVWFAFIVFLVFGLIGFLFPVFFEAEILELIKGLIAETEGMGGLELIRFIFANNLQGGFFMMMLGIVFGIFSFVALVLNGYVLGFVANMSASSAGILILWRLLPHGIFEIPAVMISAGLGLKLGSFLITYRGSHKLREFGKWLKNSLKVFVFIVIPLLVIAALIEGFLIAGFG